MQHTLLSDRPVSKASARDDSAAPWMRPRSAYLHVPFCRHHCGYCDFAVVAGRDDLADRYLDALEMELSGLGEPDPMNTIFIGGGTPTHLGPRQLRRLLSLIQHWLPLEPGGEWSIESTPDSLDDERVGVLRELGINRISIGVQSLRDADLEALDRRHSSADILPAFDRVRRHFDNVSMDLIFGVPGQTLADWRIGLAQAAALEPNHLSCYGLTYEKGTPLWKQHEAGQVESCDEELERSMFLEANDWLSQIGFEHYEVSNYARPGFRCRHNEAYWANHAYYGFGVGAARYVQGRRELNTRSIEVYLSRVAAGRSPTIQSEVLNDRERALETVTVQLRRKAGIDRSQFRQQTGWYLDHLVGPTLSRMVGWNLLEESGSGIYFTRQGWCVADAVLSEFWQGSETVPNAPTIPVMPMATPARLDREADREDVDID